MPSRRRPWSLRTQPGHQRRRPTSTRRAPPTSSTPRVRPASRRESCTPMQVLCAYASRAVDTYGLTASDRLANIAPLHFDQSTFELWAGPLAGAAVVVVPDGVLRFPASLSDLVARERATVWYSVPYAITQLVTRGAPHDRDLTALRWVLFGGESFPPAALVAAQRALPHARFSNVYGPAEVNQCTFHHLDRPPTSPEGRCDPDRSALAEHRGAARRRRRPGARGRMRGRAAREHRHDDGRLLASARADGCRHRWSCAPTQASSRPLVSHRRPGAATRRRHAGVPRAQRPPGEVARTSDRARGGRIRRHRGARGRRVRRAGRTGRRRPAGCPGHTSTRRRRTIRRCWNCCNDVCPAIRCRQKSWVSTHFHEPGWARSTVLPPRCCSQTSEAERARRRIPRVARVGCRCSFAPQ